MDNIPRETSILHCFHSLNNYEKVIKMREKVWRLEKKVYLCSGIIMYLDTTYGEKGSRFVVEL